MTDDRDDRPLVYKDNDHIIYRASGLGSCLRDLVAARQGYEPLPTPDNMEKVFERGREAEEPALEALRSRGWRIDHRQWEVMLPITEKIRVVGHIDGIGYNRNNDEGYGEDYVIELKSQTKEAWEEFERDGWELPLFQKYAWQVTVYHLAMRSPVLLVRYNLETGEIKYETPPMFYQRGTITQRILDVEAWAKTGDLPPCTPSYPCPYFYLRDGEEDRRLPCDEDMVVIGRQYNQAIVEEKVARGKKEASKKAIIEKLGIGKFEHDGVKVTVFEQNNTPRLNTERVKEAGIDLEPYYETSKSPRVKVTEP